jgi:Effector-associated domain 11
MNSQIQNLIAANKIGDAIQILIDNSVDNGILLMSRYNAANRQMSMGLVSNSENPRTMAQIAHAVLSYVGSENSYQAPPQYSAPQTAVFGDFNEKSLLEIVTTNKRRRPEIATEAQNILNEYRAWKDVKTVTPSYDPVNRRFKSLQVKADELVKRLSDEKEVSLEKIVERIAKFLESPVPKYSDLKEAFGLASGRGFRSSWIEQQLQSQPNDEEVRISIAEKIEEFTSSIYAH